MTGAVAPRSVDDVVELYLTWGQHRYDEAVSQLDHALQCAAIAVRDGEQDAFVAAALLHDIGHLLWMAGRGDASVPAHDTGHEAVGADALAGLFAEDVCEPVRLHVQAKRVLLALDEGYAASLSPGSTASAVRQGGPASPEEIQAFEARPWAEDALRLRRIDDAGKVLGLEVRPFGDYVEMLRELVDDVPSWHVGRT